MLRLLVVPPAAKNGPRTTGQQNDTSSQTKPQLADTKKPLQTEAKDRNADIRTTHRKWSVYQPTAVILHVYMCIVLNLLLRYALGGSPPKQTTPCDKSAENYILPALM